MSPMDILHWSDGVLVVLDFETSGVNPNEDRIVTAALIFTTPKGRALHMSYAAMVNPGIEIPAGATEIHGITTERAITEGVHPELALREIVGRLQHAAGLGMPLLIYNACFDLPLLHAECARHGIADVPDLFVIDPLVLSRHYGKYAKGGHKLATVCARYGVQLTEAHAAHADAAACADLLRAMIRQHGMEDWSLEEWQDKQREMHAAWAEGMNAYWERLGKSERIAAVEWPGVRQFQHAAAA